MSRKALWVMAVLFVGSTVVLTACSGGGGGAVSTPGGNNGPALDNNPLLSGLAVSPGTLSPVFSSATATYTSLVSVTTSTVGVTATAEGNNATMTINGAAVVSAATYSVGLSVGANPIAIVVTAEDGTSTKTYTITVTRPSLACSSDAGCAAGYYCSSTGTCIVQKFQGGTCNLTTDCMVIGCRECISGNCVDGYCCNSVCSDQCAACNVAGNLGICSAVTGAPVGSRTACIGQGTVCGGTCNGSSTVSCTYPSGTSCGAGLTCSVGICQ